MTSFETRPETTSLVLCGGRGERMGPDYSGTQKVLVDIGGISLLEQVVRGATKAPDGNDGNRGVYLLTGYRGADVADEVKRWPRWLQDKVVGIQGYKPGESSLGGITSRLRAPATMLSGNVLMEYPGLLNDAEDVVGETATPVVVGSTTLRTSTHYAVETDGLTVSALERRAATPAAREVVDVFGLTDQVIELSDRLGVGCATAIAQSTPGAMQPRYIEYTGGWAHFETPDDFAKYLRGEYGNFDYR